ncbi:bifunctional methylenetetrahydrofolate dehydrogenase/methenyltetrahydrofolate cyclohydrolase [Candidatus Uhrbacteria bacterium]|jgi:methylenetetrahydrofolate dehydrogenase (NADP+) / methenyltetrahydrofolate cyclohydrolase|nr:bifunctional methylenetetrahydrofolate dehydrogenase/methenyltetrahydrofolate cyclohydrolase [Candidatus Uhrbacteria bacterium]
MAELLKGKQLAASIREKAKKRIAKLDHPPGMAAILVGDDAASHLYVRLKEEASKEAGIYFEKITPPAGTSTKELVAIVEALNVRDDIHGILVQLPLPTQDEDAVIAAIDPTKDIDGFHPHNRELRSQGEPSLFPPVALSIMRLIQASNQPLKQKTATVIANNEVFVEPLMALLAEQDIDAQFFSPESGALAAKTRVSDIIVIAVGRAGFIKKDMIKDGAIIIDVGTNKVGDKTVGDVDRPAREKAAFVTPVPGGVGPLTVAYLLMNVVRAYGMQKNKI